MDEKRQSSITLRVMWTLLTLLILYPQSTGPLVWLESRDLLSESWPPTIAIIYFPLAQLYDSETIPVLPSLLQTYIELWEA